MKCLCLYYNRFLLLREVLCYAIWIVLQILSAYIVQKMHIAIIAKYSWVSNVKKIDCLLWSKR